MNLTMLLLSVAALRGDDVLVNASQIQNMENVLLLDVRDAEDVEKGHIPGAAHVDVESLSETREGVQGLLKPVDEVRRLIAAPGVDPSKHMVVYSSADELKRATRMFWILEYLGYENVSVLDGGYEQWVALGQEPATGPASADPVPVSALPAEVRPELLASREDVKTSDVSVVDMRPAAEYTGESKKDFVAKKGHIPGASNLPAGDLVEDDALTFRPVRVIADLVDQKKSKDSERVITYCNTGRDASVGYFAYRLAGHDHVALYDGSMAEWAQSEDVVQGQE